MSTTRELLELFRAIGQRDIERADAVASRIALNEEKKGHLSAARHLKGALRSASLSGQRQPAQALNAELGGTISSALVPLNATRGLDSVELPEPLRNELRQVVSEWKLRDFLARNGVEPRSKLLFHGPPGCGKSLTAQALGKELGLPVYVVRFDAIIGAFLGQTAIHLRQLFQFAEQRPCVLLLDELDALGKQRGNPLDVGELDRIVISLMQELEHSQPRGIIVGTSNLPKHLDDALWRRFDLAMHFPIPRPLELRQFARKLARSRDHRLKNSVLTAAVSAKTFSGAERVILADIRSKLLTEAAATNG